MHEQTKGKSLEQIDLLFTGPKVLIDISEDDLLEMQQQQIEHAAHENRVGLKGATTFGDAEHDEGV